MLDNKEKLKLFSITSEINHFNKYFIYINVRGQAAQVHMVFRFVQTENLQGYNFGYFDFQSFFCFQLICHEQSYFI